MMKMGREAYYVERRVAHSTKISPNLEWEELIAEIDALPSERIGVRDSIRLTTKMAKLLKGRY